MVLGVNIEGNDSITYNVGFETKKYLDTKLK